MNKLESFINSIGLLTFAFFCWFVFWEAIEVEYYYLVAVVLPMAVTMSVAGELQLLTALGMR